MKQALSSIKLKKFHAQGGSAYALYLNKEYPGTINFIVSFQTISDYLDNLCDRAGVQDEKAFRQLHRSMLAAVDTSINQEDYYMLYPYKNDNNYLSQLVNECRLQISKLPNYSLVKDYIKHYVSLYIDLQSYKHLSPDIREQKLLSWADEYVKIYPLISPWEFSASAGSTLGIFAMYTAAQDLSLTKEEAASINNVYFPWISGLHILLDYYIDLIEDSETNDLNFVSYYKNLEQCEERLSYFVKESLGCCSALKHPGFHITIIKGLLSMYLSDPKASLKFNTHTSKKILRSGGKEALLYYNLCKLLRLAKVL